MTVSDEILIDVLHLPDNTKILGVDTETALMDMLRNQTTFYVEHPDIPDGIPGGVFPQVKPRFTSHYNKRGKITRVTFEGWG
jgi:hypothetical protein